MTIVAEGVESFEELAYLQAATRIRYGQGFYFARPFMLEDFTHPKHRVLEDRADEIKRPIDLDFISRDIRQPGQG
jgi:c-di-GMP phosphodiesterase Gmr